MIATTQLKLESVEGYAETAKVMVARALSMPGCLGAEAARGDDGFGIIVSYFTDEDALAAWRDDLEHWEVKDKGKRTWYQQYRVRIAKFEKCYEGPLGRKLGQSGSAAVLRSTAARKVKMTATLDGIEVG